MKIGFFGDSFCAMNHISKDYEYTTYINKLENYYNADIVNLGVVGSSIYDLLLLQLTPFIESDTVPDVCIFVWTNVTRLYNKDIRHLNCLPEKYLYKIIKTEAQKNILDAARHYYLHLQDTDLDLFKAKAVLYYFDNEILKSLPTTKIIHLWSFGEMDNGYTTYIHRWKTGVEIRPALIRVVSPNGYLGNNFDPNHLSDDKKNEIVFEWIKEAIDNYENGKLIDESSTI